MVTDEEFRAFLDEVITPRFPNGLTMLSGAGQFRGSSRMIQLEGAVFVILLYPADEQEQQRAHRGHSKQAQENLRPGICAACRRQVLCLFLSASHYGNDGGICPKRRF